MCWPPCGVSVDLALRLMVWLIYRFPDTKTIILRSLVFPRFLSVLDLLAVSQKWWFPPRAPILFIGAEVREGRIHITIGNNLLETFSSPNHKFGGFCVHVCLPQGHAQNVCSSLQTWIFKNLLKTSNIVFVTRRHSVSICSIVFIHVTFLTHVFGTVLSSSAAEWWLITMVSVVQPTQTGNYNISNRITVVSGTAWSCSHLSHYLSGHQSFFQD